ADDRLNAIFGDAFARQDALAGEAQRDDLPPARIVGLELGQDPGADEHDFVALHARLTERSARIDLDNSMRNFGEHAGQTGLQARGDQSLAQGNSWRRRLYAPTRQDLSPRAKDASPQRCSQVIKL